MFILFQTQNQDDKVPMFAVARGSVKCCVRLGSGGAGGASLSAAGGGAGLLQAHRFAQPAGKIHFFHL